MKESGIDWIGQIPEEWEVAKVNHIFEEHKQKNRGNKEKNLLSLSYGRIIRKSIDSSFGLLPESFDTYNIIQRGDIVLRLTDLQNDKRSLRVGLARENGIITSAYLTLRLKNLESNDSYMYYLLHTYDICKVFYNFGGGVRQGGTWSDIYKMELLIPPCNEQQKIADFLDKKTAQLDKAKALLEEQIQKLKDYRASLIYETVTKGLDKTIPMKDSGIDWIGQVPQGWGVKPLKYLIEFKNGYAFDSQNLTIEQTGVKVIRIGDFKSSGIDFNAALNVFTSLNSKLDFYRIRKSQILIAMSGATVGKISFVNQEPNVYSVINQRVGIIESKISKWMYYCLSTDSFMSYIQLNSNGSAQPNISSGEISDFKVAIPNDVVIQKCVKYLDNQLESINKLIQIKNQQIENINKQRQTLIYDYVTGKRRV